MHPEFRDDTIILFVFLGTLIALCLAGEFLHYFLLWLDDEMQDF